MNRQRRLRRSAIAKVLRHVWRVLVLTIMYLCLLALKECREDTKLMFNTGMCPKQPQPIYGINYNLLHYTSPIIETIDNTWFRTYFILPCKEHLSILLIFVGALLDLVTLPSAASYILIELVLLLLKKVLPVIVVTAFRKCIEFTKRLLCLIFNLQPRVQQPPDDIEAAQ